MRKGIFTAAFGHAGWTDMSLTIEWEVSGIFVGYMPVKSILESILVCLYDQRCIDQLLSFSATNITFAALPLTNGSIINENSTVISLVE